MKSRKSYIYSLIFAHLVFIVIAVFIIRFSSILFIVSEFLILLSLFISVKSYLDAMKPWSMLLSTVDSITEKDFNYQLRLTGNPDFDKLITVYNNMLDRLNQEKIKQEEQHFFLDKLIEASPAGIIILDFDEKITHINPSAISYLGSSNNSYQGKELGRITHPLAIELSKLENEEHRLIVLNGLNIFKAARAFFFDRGFNHSFIIVHEVAEEIVKAEESAYKKIIRLMSHEINNSIGAINSLLDSMRDYGDQLKSGDKEEFCGAVEVAIHRNENLRDFTRNFSDAIRIPQPMLQEKNLHDLLLSVYMLMNHECQRRDIKWKWSLCDKDIIVRIDTQLMEQVLVNIIKNAIESIEKGGSITLETRLERHPKLIIHDTGHGIPDEVSKQLFSPFFTTKKNGQGIGLTFIRDVLTMHGFKFSLSTVKKEDTEFVIEFGK